MITGGGWIEVARQRFRRIEAGPLPQNVAALLLGAAKAVPDRAALHFIENDLSITYAQLHTDVRRLVRGLCSVGIGHGTTVAVMLPNIRAMPTTWLALASIGAVMVPVDTGSTAAELHGMLTRTGATHLILDAAQHGLLAAMPAGMETIVATGPGVLRGPGVVSWEDLLERDPAHFEPDIEPELDDLLDIQYSPGNGGPPKGCLLTQRYWLTCAKAHASCDGLIYRRILSPKPFSDPAPQWLMLMAFYQRASLYVAPHLDATGFTDWLRRYEIDFCEVPGRIAADAPSGPDHCDLQLLRGTAAHRKEGHVVFERRFGVPARPAFIMTEIGLGLVMPVEAASTAGSGSCGLPAPFREARIATPAGMPIPPNQPGELLIRGPGMFLGYHGQTVQSDADFHGDWFRTRHLARQDSDGFVTVLGQVEEGWMHIPPGAEPAATR